MLVDVKFCNAKEEKFIIDYASQISSKEFDFPVVADFWWVAVRQNRYHISVCRIREGGLRGGA